jgi:multisubunit Na+/H+ antiporter MnhC subunit
MPTDTALVVTGVVIAFTAFAVALAWADRRTTKR